MSSKIKVAINGFGRIGRNLFRLLLNHPSIEVVAINDIADNRTMSHLVKYDSIHGILPFAVSYDDDSIIIDGKSYAFYHEKEIANLNWSGIDFVIESTGKFKTFDEINQHIELTELYYIIKKKIKENSFGNVPSRYITTLKHYKYLAKYRNK